MCTGLYYVELKITMAKEGGGRVDRHVVIYDAGFRRSQGERLFYGAIKDNYGDAKLLEACDRVWRGKPEVPPARAMWRSLFPAAAKVEVANAWLCERV